MWKNIMLVVRLTAAALLITIGPGLVAPESLVARSYQTGCEYGPHEGFSCNNGIANYELFKCMNDDYCVTCKEAPNEVCDGSSAGWTLDVE